MDESTPFWIKQVAAFRDRQVDAGKKLMWRALVSVPDAHSRKKLH